ncbi:MAG: endonuclease domain-containing protein [Candidatus Falkowbacteria bacterium]|nr:endonuclease domain-containing protein [Candidatus Falkowbacteria bacterium]
MSYKNKIILAREFRSNPTKAESIMWQILKDEYLLNYKFRRQYVIAGYILDFYCQSLKLGIEVDGGIHNIPKNMNADIKRQQIIKQYGVEIIRITNEEIISTPILVFQKLRNHIESIIQNYFL